MRKKELIIHSKSDPLNPELGFGDMLYLYNEENLKFACECSCCPNPYKPSNPKIKWNQFSGFIDFGEYSFVCREHPEFGKCLLINNGGKVNSRSYNPNKKAYHMTGVYLHEANIGYKNPLWRGSRGCITVHRNLYFAFMSNFYISEIGVLKVVKNFKFKQQISFFVLLNRLFRRRKG